MRLAELVGRETRLASMPATSEATFRSVAAASSARSSITGETSHLSTQPVAIFEQQRNGAVVSHLVQLVEFGESRQRALPIDGSACCAGRQRRLCVRVTDEETHELIQPR